MDLKSELKKTIPKELVDKLFEHYSQIKNNFRLGRHENTELNASKFAEVVFRILENDLSGNYVKLDKQIHKFTDKCRAFETMPSAGKDDTLRIHIPRTLILIVDVRNKRGVGHVSGIHNPNDLDSIFVKTNCDWIFAEICRVFAKLPLDQAQNQIDNIIKIELPLVEKIDDINRVLDTSLSYQNEVLVLLLSEYPKFVKFDILFHWTEHSNKKVFRDLLKEMHKRRFIELRDDECKLLQPGINEAEEIIKNNKL